jgi:hypothetical protein
LLLKRELENCADEKFGQLLPYIGSFLKFLGGLLVSMSSNVFAFFVMPLQIWERAPPASQRGKVVSLVKGKGSNLGEAQGRIG